MEENEREVELIDYIETVLKRKFSILLVTLACVAITIIYIGISPRLYRASALISITPPSTR